uniref:Uncharacterized protein n=1 Tax=Zea mays TaxID=4577 RepID=A0A804RSP8_MAIZE
RGQTPPPDPPAAARPTRPPPPPSPPPEDASPGPPHPALAGSPGPPEEDASLGATERPRPSQESKSPLSRTGRDIPTPALPRTTGVRLQRRSLLPPCTRFLSLQSLMSDQGASRPSRSSRQVPTKSSAVVAGGSSSAATPT